MIIYKLLKKPFFGQFMVNWRNPLTENEKKNWIIEGFPRTKIQALSLSKLGIIPDKLINI